ncbi:MAG: histidinol dehydrogenase, partial [Erysipelotrichaceae bacterium]|nr:histidinol dehydrogenase [Erysipelotrichaceae bacterium]
MLKEISPKDTASFEAYLKSREQKTSNEVVTLVNDILENVRTNKDKALFEYNEKFDQVTLTSLKVSDEEINNAMKLVDPAFLKAMEEAAENIRLYHEPQVRQGYEIKKDNGVILGQRVIPLEKVGVYVPGGRAAYPSTVLMNVIPAKIAGVDDIVMVTPPSKDGSINPYILAAAKIAGVTQIYKVGGAQAIAALAFGTESIPRVDKIVGPGNQWVATAKRLVYGIVDIDMIAGPSEILVIADENANPAYTAADLLSQAEH